MARRRAAARRRQARPDRAAGQAQVVEPRHVVGIKTRRQQLGFPRRDRRLEALQLADHGVERVGPLAPIVRHQMLPAEQEAHEILRADGLDFLPQPLHRVAMNSREQRPIAPFLRRRERREGARHCNALRRQRGERRIDVGHGHAHRSGDGCAGHGSRAPRDASARFRRAPLRASMCVVKIPPARRSAACASPARRPRRAAASRSAATHSSHSRRARRLGTVTLVARRCRASSARKPGHAALRALSAGVMKARPSSASCISSALVASGHASSRTRSIAAMSSCPSVDADASSSHRLPITACVRRSSSGASSR